MSRELPPLFQNFFIFRSLVAILSQNLGPEAPNQPTLRLTTSDLKIKISEKADSLDILDMKIFGRFYKNLTIQCPSSVNAFL